jgi:DNA replication and repair protein RecF
MCRVSGSVASGGVERVVAFALTRKVRNQFLDDRKINSPEEYLQALKIVHFIPEDVGLVGGSPAWRRRVIDRSVFEVTPHYVSEYRKYLQVLRQRNALLRKGEASAAEKVRHRRLNSRAGITLLPPAALCLWKEDSSL